jgi:pimeloyl-ACP methyl ester carboxylesterase
MVKKTLLSLAIAATTAGLAGCNISSVEKHNNEVDSTPVDAGKPGVTPVRVAPIFSAGNSDLPINVDILFAEASSTDGTAATNDTTPPVTTAINKLPGFSTTASFFLPFNVALNPATVVAGQTVFLIELKSAEDDASIDALDLNTIVAANPTNPFAEGADQVTSADYSARYVTLDNGATHAIQVTPLKPLDPKTKYIVALTNDIKGADGRAATRSAEYELLSGSAELPSSALAPVRTAVQGWEKLAGGFLSQATGSAIQQKDVIMSYAFTTDGSLDALKNYAAPSLFVANNLPLANAEAIIESAQAGATTSIAQQIVLGGGGNPADADQVAAAKLTSQYAAAIYSQIAGSALPGAPASLNALVDRPSARAVNIISGAAVDGAIGGDGASPATFLGTSDTFTRYYQGQIELPNFLDKVTLTTEFTKAGISGAMAADADWSANTTVGAVLDAALGNPAGTTPPKDKDGSTNVTYRYPFAQPSTEGAGKNYAPLLVTMPDDIDYSVGGTNPAGKNCSGMTEVPVVLYVHGITGSRGNSLGYAAGLAANCIATVAIDLPLHGIAPLATNANGETVDNALKAFDVEPGKAALTGSPWGAVAAASTPDFDNIAERHNNIDQNSLGARVVMDFDGSASADGTDGSPAVGKSGSAFINLSNFTRSRDNLRQAVVDLLNLNASLGNISTEIAAQTGGVGLDLDKVYLAGHSLGAIVATTFAAVNNAPEVLAANTSLNKVQGVMLANGGAHISKLLENSPSFGPTIINGLAAAGVDQGTSNFEKFMYVIQSTIDVVDPANAGLKLAETDTPLVLFNMVGGNSLPTVQADLAKISYPDGFKVVGSYLPDHTVPNFDYFADADTNPYRGFATALGMSEGVPTALAPMAGTNGLASVMGLETVNAETTIGDLASPTRVVARFAEGTHSTFANADAPGAFTEMLTQSLMLINGTYTSVNTAVLESSN